MSWVVDAHSYRAIAVCDQIDDLSKRMRTWAHNFEKSLALNEKAAFVVQRMFTEKRSKGIITQKASYTYNVVNDGKDEDDFSDLFDEISHFALGNQNSFGVFVQMEEKEDPEWFVSYDDFYGSVVQVRDEYTREMMLKMLGLTENRALESVFTQETVKK